MNGGAVPPERGTLCVLTGRPIVGIQALRRASRHSGRCHRAATSAPVRTLAVTEERGPEGGTTACELDVGSALVATGLLAGGLALAVAVPSASAVYNSNGEPVWIPRSAANATDQSRADNRALARAGTTIYVGGDFTEVAPELGAPGVAIANLAAFDATTGVPVAAFQPQLDGKVYALVADASTNTLYVGGSFTGGFAILDATTGARKGTQLTTDGEVHALYRDGGRPVRRRPVPAVRSRRQPQDDGPLQPGHPRRRQLRSPVHRWDGGNDRHGAQQVAVYAGGRFSALNGATVGKVVALSPATGALDPSFAPPINTTK